MPTSSSKTYTVSCDVYNPDDTFYFKLGSNGTANELVRVSVYASNKVQNISLSGTSLSDTTYLTLQVFNNINSSRVYIDNLRIVEI